MTGEIDAPCLVNVDEAGKVGDLTAAELEALGFRIAIYPGLARYAAGYAIREALGVLKRDGSTKAARDRMLTTSGNTTKRSSSRTSRSGSGSTYCVNRER